MKPKLFLKTTLLFLFFSFSCDKEENLTPEEQLPPATQTGAGTFACLVNGELFNDTDGRYFNCYYQFVNGGYYFSINGENDNFFISQIIIGSNDHILKEGETYDLRNNIQESYYGECAFKDDGSSVDTGETQSGKLKITKFDLEERIVAGTFWFDVINPKTGDTIKIRKGRFDTLFTR